MFKHVVKVSLIFCHHPVHLKVVVAIILKFSCIWLVAVAVFMLDPTERCQFPIAVLGRVLKKIDPKP